MEKNKVTKTLVMLFLLLFVSVAFADVPTNEVTNPENTQYWPSVYGATDEIGAINLITPAKSKAAGQMIKEGKVYDLGQEIYVGYPAFPPRNYTSMVLMHGQSWFRDITENKVTWLEEYIATNIGISTHVDGLAHLGTNERAYNGFKYSEFAFASGLLKLGVEKIPPVVTRAILIDMVAFKGRALKAGEIVTLADYKAALAKQGIADCTAGDVVLFYWGWQDLLNETGVDKDTLRKNREIFGAGEPGPSQELLHYLVKKGAVMVGSDGWGLEPVPFEHPNRPWEGHQYMLGQNGVYILEMLNLKKAAADKVYEFCYVAANVKLRGLPQGWIRPVGIK